MERRGGWEERVREEEAKGGREKDKRDCSIKRNVNPAHTHCEYPRYLQWVGRPFASAAGVEPFHWAAPSLPLFVHASPSLSLSPPLSRVFHFPSREPSPRQRRSRPSLKQTIFYRFSTDLVSRKRRRKIRFEMYLQGMENYIIEGGFTNFSRKFERSSNDY